MGTSSPGPPFNLLLGVTDHKLESTETAGAFWRWGTVYPILSTEQLGESACLCVCQGCRWYQTLEAAGTEANGAKAQDGGQDWGRPPRSANPSPRCAVPAAQRPVFQQPVQSHPRHRVGSGEHPPSAQPEPAALAGPPWTALHTAFFWPRCCSLGCSVISYRHSLLCPEPLASG